MEDTTIRFSPIHGIGLFAERDFEPGEEVIKLSGAVLHENTYGDWIFYFDPKKPFGMHWVQISQRAYLDPKNFGRYVNHSCDPNCGIRGTRSIVARRDIRKEEEVAFDYAMSDWDYFEFLCNCQESNCRGVVRGYRYLPLDRREEYKGFLSRHLERLSEFYQNLRQT